MKKSSIFMLLCLVTSYQYGLQIKARASKHAAMPLLLVGVNTSDRESNVQQLLAVVRDDLSFTGQFKVDVRSAPSLKERSLWQTTYPIIIVLEQTEDKALSWSLYDSSQNKCISTKYAYAGSIPHKQYDRAQAHEVSDAVWHILTGAIGFFSTRIAYCREIDGHNRRLKHIYIADYDGTYEQVLVDTPTVNIGPRWNRDPSRPLVFYSEFTNTNVRMMYIDMKKGRHVASNFDGINMLPAFSDDGKKAVFCASQGTGNAQLYYVEQGQFKQLTNNASNNFCPALSADGNQVYFCSDYGLRQPSMFCFDIDSKKLKRIPNTAASESPSYCSANLQLAYCKATEGIMQLFTYDTIKKSHTQLTFDRSAKHGVSWSPCGSYVLYAQDYANKSLLRMMHVPTKQVYTIAQSDQKLTFPAWSPRYSSYPVV